jgi:hypothetical protein
MMTKVFAIAMWMGMFCAFLWAARAPRHVVAMRRAFLLDDGPVSPTDIWILRALLAFCIVCATWAAVITGHPWFAFCFVPAALLLHGFIELVRSNVLTRVAGRYWTLRLSAGAAWAIGVFEWHEGEYRIAAFVAAIGLFIAIWPAPAAHFLADYAGEETQVKWTRWSGIFGCAMAIVVVIFVATR